jgi:transposase
VDFGEFSHIEINGKGKKLYAFSIILEDSRIRYAEFTTDISTENIIKMYIKVFEYVGHFTDTILYETVKQITMDGKINASEARFNEKFMDFAYIIHPQIEISIPLK